MRNLLKKIFSIGNEYNGYKCTYKVITIFGIKLKFIYDKNNIKVSKKDKLKFLDYILNQQLDKSDFVALSEKKYQPKDADPKLIAFYLPQFHSFESNDRWFGRGFTEWSNAAKTTPQFVGHYQPHLPIDVGFYNLETTAAMRRQIELAKQHGIYGFCFYYYWYSGKKIMEKPIEALLADKTLDMPFFMFWANEDWTRLWGDGSDKEVLFKQRIIEGDARRFMDDILPYMKDSRYIKINGKPLLIIYNPELYPIAVLTKFIDEIRQIAKDSGFEDLYINTIMKPFMQAGFYAEYLKEHNFDAIVEFIPGGVHYKLFNQLKRKVINPLFVGHHFDVEDFVKQEKYLYKADARVFKGLFTSWDNTARSCYRGACVMQSTPALYKKWLKGLIKWTKENNPKDEQFIFINAWNEWAEGAHLEPDQRYGYAFLEATRQALEEDD